MVSNAPYGDRQEEEADRLPVNLAADYARVTPVVTPAGSTSKMFTLVAALNQGYQRRLHAFGARNRTTINGYTDCKGNHFGAVQRLVAYNVTNAEVSQSASAKSL